MTTIDHERVQQAAPRRLPRRAWDLVLAHPVLTVLLLALGVRLLVAGALLATGRWPLAPDERQYVDLADLVASGQPASAWAPGWGDHLFDQTAAYLWPVTLLFKAFGPYVFLAQVVSAVAGAAAAALTCRLGLLALPRGLALAAGVLVALLPSQVLWSSLVLRESSVWAALAVLATACALACTTRSWPRLAALAVLAAASLLCLAYLRPYVFVVACWALALAALVAGALRRVAVPVGAAVLAVSLPLAIGLGPAGLTLVGQNLPAVAALQQGLALGADSAIVAPPPPPPPPLNAAPDAAPPAVVAQREEPSASGGVRGIPRGLVAVTLRPFVWEPATGSGSRFAQAENLLWIALYGLAAVGLWAQRRSRWLVAFPAVFTVGFLLMSALFEGNVGTAFRHRGQVLWALALLGAVGVAHLRSRRTTAVATQPAEFEAEDVRARAQSLSGRA